MIVEAKERYTNKLSKKLDHPSTMPKEYWSILNTLLNNKKIPNIPPLDVNGKIISNFDKKAKLFNSNFASQSTPIFFFFSIGVFYHNHSRITGLQGKGEQISLTPRYHFHPLHIHLHISRAITAESSPLHVASSQTRTENLWFLSASH